MMLLGNLYNFHTLSLSNLASPFANILSIVGIKWTIFVNLSTTTKIKSYPYANGSLVMKSANIYVQGFLDIELGINLPVGYSMWFLFLWQKLHLSIYCFISLVTPGHQKFWVTNSTVFYYPPCPSTGVSWYSPIISALNISSLGTYFFFLIYYAIYFPPLFIY